MHTIGVISDTHGRLRPEALEHLRGVDHIIHAGDIGGAHILEALRAIAPLTAVRGNNDSGDWTRELLDTATLEIAGRRLYVIHNLQELALDPASAGVDVVIAGHSHRPLIREENGVLWLNPGSAGPRRFKLPVSLAMLYVSVSEMRAELRGLDARSG